MHGKAETLCVLLEVYAAAPEVVEMFRLPAFSLLYIACRAANLDIVHFILDSHNSHESQLPLGAVDLNGERETEITPILAAAESLRFELSFDVEDAEKRKGPDRNAWIQDRIARGQQLIHFLLDRGFSATDVIPQSIHDTARSYSWYIVVTASKRKSFHARCHNASSSEFVLECRGSQTASGPSPSSK